MRLIKFGVLALSLVLVTACGKKTEEQATQPAPATTAAPAPAPAPEAAPAATENAATPVPAQGSPLATESAALACTTGCTPMRCPPPNGPYICCKLVSGKYQACP